MLNLIASQLMVLAGWARYLPIFCKRQSTSLIWRERSEEVTIEKESKKNVCMRVGHASGPAATLSFFPSSWPLTSVAYNKSCLDQSHRACKTLQTCRNQITLSPYPFPRLSRRHQAFRRKLGSPKSRMHRPR